MTKYKWYINPDATLREFISERMDGEPGYLKTICGVHRKLWILINCGAGMRLPQEELEEINHWLEIAFRMGKRMDFRLQQYFREARAATEGDALAHSMTGKFVAEIPKEVWETKLAEQVSMVAKSAKKKGNMKRQKRGERKR